MRLLAAGALALVMGCVEFLPGSDRALDASRPDAPDAPAERDQGVDVPDCGGNREPCCGGGQCEGNRRCVAMPGGSGRCQ